MTERNAEQGACYCCQQSCSDGCECKYRLNRNQFIRQFGQDDVWQWDQHHAATPVQSPEEGQRPEMRKIRDFIFMTKIRDFSGLNDDELTIAQNNVAEEAEAILNIVDGLLDAPTSAPVQETWVIKFDDCGMPGEVFTGEGAQEAAQKRFDALSENWTVTLLRSVPTPVQECLENRVAEWVRTRIGEENMHPRERAMRLLEEAIELAQAEGVTEEQALKQTGYVFGRPVGDPRREAGGVAVCLLGWCAARGEALLNVATAEVERIEAKPVEQIRGSLARKMDQDLVVATPVQECPKQRALEMIVGSGPRCLGKGVTQDDDGVPFTPEQQEVVDALHRSACKRCIAQQALATPCSCAGLREQSLKTISPTYCPNCGFVNLKGEQQ